MQMYAEEFVVEFSHVRGNRLIELMCGSSTGDCGDCADNNNNNNNMLAYKAPVCQKTSEAPG